MGKSWIDYINRNRIKEFKVHDELIMSNHCLLTFDLIICETRKYYDRVASLLDVHKWKLRIDLEEYSIVMSSKLEGNPDVDNYIVHVSKGIKNLLKKNKKKEVGIKTRWTPWWNDKLQIMRS